MYVQQSCSREQTHYAAQSRNYNSLNSLFMRIYRNPINLLWQRAPHKNRI